MCFILLIAFHRKKLFNMINSLPTIFEVVTGSNRKNTKEKHPNSKSNKSSLKVVRLVDTLRILILLFSFHLAFWSYFVLIKQSRQSEVKASGMAPPKQVEDEEDDDNEDDDEHDYTLCGACGVHYADDEFWICCDLCERWFHGKCVKITPARAEHIKQYKCPSCSSSKRTRAWGERR